MSLRPRTLLNLCGCILSLALPMSAVHAQTITVAWRDKPPHQYLENGKEKGILLELAHKVFADAGLSSRFVEEPAKRIWQHFANKTPNYCSFGWYKIAEREALVQYSDAMYRDPPHTLLVAKTLHVTAAPMIMVRMINANRASMLFIDREDWHYLRSKEPALQDVHQVDLDGMPAGLDRYIICSKDVAPEVMTKINQALAKRVVPAKAAK
ncbi:MAG: hypothetical protein HYR92_01075 [Burkholderiales bacterium]|nr:hypothetical protein [Burkholderiales bacterium]